jgi:ubiquinone/menaquinone biosynthesis C-methylase UbiE
MAYFEDKIVERYSDPAREDNRSTLSRARGIEFHYTKKIVSEFINAESSVIEIGCGTGYYGLYFSDKCKEYIGIDLSPESIQMFNEKINSNGIKNVKAFVGNAIKLDTINNSTYDVVLVLGPMYHLPLEKRELVIKESKRICKNGGIIIYAYINKLGAYLYGILRLPEKYPNKNANELVLLNETDDIFTDIFYYTTPEKIADYAIKNELRIIKNVGVDFNFSENTINEMDEEKYKCWLEFSDYMCQSESCTGLSNHALLICKKER